jgi:hypothetical protein
MSGAQITLHLLATLLIAAGWLLYHGCILAAAALLLCSAAAVIGCGIVAAGVTYLVCRKGARHGTVA